MRGLFDLGYAAKAWIAAAVAFATQAVAAWQMVVADEAISFDEAEGLWLLATEALGLVLGLVAVFKTRNAPTPAAERAFEMPG
jgi:hypothetical protein